MRLSEIDQISEGLGISDYFFLYIKYNKFSRKVTYIVTNVTWRINSLTNFQVYPRSVEEIIKLKRHGSPTLTEIPSFVSLLCKLVNHNLCKFKTLHLHNIKVGMSMKVEFLRKAIILNNKVH